MINTSFPIRKDLYGVRYVFFLGNEGGNCKYQCAFCEIGKSNAISSEYNIELFDNLFREYLVNVSNQKNHPLIYNRGNITDEKAFSKKTLVHLLTQFSGYPNISHISLNSREREVNNEFIDFILKMNLPYPIHFILGQESYSSKTYRIIGKNSNGEFLRLSNKLIHYNDKNYFSENRSYNFGIDVNILYLPELYIGEVNRNQYKNEIIEGFLNDIKKTLEYSSLQVPLTINIHPFYKVKSLPYENADIDQLMVLIPQVIELVNEHNKRREHKTAMFIGFRGIKTSDKHIDVKIDNWNNIFDLFNEKNAVQFKY